jgi:hypothetical protein
LSGKKVAVDHKKVVVKISTKSNIQKISRCLDYMSGCSQNRVSRRFNCSQQYISTILKKYNNIRCYKKYKKPQMTSAQKAAARLKCRKIVEKYNDLDFFLDD